MSTIPRPEPCTDPIPVALTAEHPVAGVVEMNVYCFTNVSEYDTWFVAFRRGNQQPASITFTIGTDSKERAVSPGTVEELYVQALLASQDVNGWNLTEDDLDQDLALELANEFVEKQVKLVIYQTRS